MTRADIAWNNAIDYTNKEPKQFRMCYICDHIMNHGTKWNIEQEPKNGWDIDHVDGNSKNNKDSNLVAVHHTCNNEKGNKNFLHIYIEKKKRLWNHLG